MYKAALWARNVEKEFPVITRFFLDFEKTFGTAELASVEPKKERVNKSDPNSEQVQSRTADGMLKWIVTLGTEKEMNGRLQHEYVPITIVSPTKPFGAIPIHTHVTVEELEMGIMKQDGSRGGYLIFYSAKSIRPVQPARATSGQ